MKKIFILITFVFVNQTCLAEDNFSSEDELSKWLTYYYLKPEPNKLAPAIKFMSKKGAFDKRSAFPGIFGFVSGVMKENPNKVNKWLKDLSMLNTEHYGVMIWGVWYANLPNSKEIAYKMIDKNEKYQEQFSYLKKGNPIEIHNIPLEQGPWVLDALWGQFMATGSDVPVKRIAQCLSWIDVKGDTGKLLIGGAANWSLRSNAIQHKRVYSIVKKLSIEDPKNTFIQKVLIDVDTELKKTPK